MFVGEAPGFHEDQQGFPFVGQAGKLLDKLLAGHRPRPLVTSTSRTSSSAGRPGTATRSRTRSSRASRTCSARSSWCSRSSSRRSGTSPRSSSRGKPHGITRVHGTPQTATLGGHSVTLYPLYHPAAALYTPAMLRTLEEDFARIPSLLGRASEPEPHGAGDPDAARRPRGRARRAARPLLTTLRRMVEVESSSPEETERIAAAPRRRARAGRRRHGLGRSRRGQDDLRARRGRALGVAGPVTSPTYTIGHRYEGRVPVAHLDLYRFERLASADWADLERVLRRRGRVRRVAGGGRGFLPAAAAADPVAAAGWRRVD